MMSLNLTVNMAQCRPCEVMQFLLFLLQFDDSILPFRVLFYLDRLKVMCLLPVDLVQYMAFLRRYPQVNMARRHRQFLLKKNILQFEFDLRLSSIVHNNLPIEKSFDKILLGLDGGVLLFLEIVCVCV